MKSQMQKTYVWRCSLHFSPIVSGAEAANRVKRALASQEAGVKGCAYFRFYASECAFEDHMRGHSYQGYDDALDILAHDICVAEGPLETWVQHKHEVAVRATYMRMTPAACASMWMNAKLGGVSMDRRAAHPVSTHTELVRGMYAREGLDYPALIDRLT